MCIYSHSLSLYIVASTLYWMECVSNKFKRLLLQLNVKQVIIKQNPQNHYIGQSTNHSNFAKNFWKNLSCIQHIKTHVTHNLIGRLLGYLITLHKFTTYRSVSKLHSSRMWCCSVRYRGNFIFKNLTKSDSSTMKMKPVQSSGMFVPVYQIA